MPRCAKHVSEYYIHTDEFTPVFGFGCMTLKHKSYYKNFLFNPFTTEYIANKRSFSSCTLWIVFHFLPFRITALYPDCPGNTVLVEGNVTSTNKSCLFYATKRFPVNFPGSYLSELLQRGTGWYRNPQGFIMFHRQNMSNKHVTTMVSHRFST